MNPTNAEAKGMKTEGRSGFQGIQGQAAGRRAGEGRQGWSGAKQVGNRKKQAQV